MCSLACIWRAGQGTACTSQFSPSTTWILGIERGSSGWQQAPLASELPSCLHTVTLFSLSVLYPRNYTKQSVFYYKIGFVSEHLPFHGLT